MDRYIDNKANWYQEVDSFLNEMRVPEADREHTQGRLNMLILNEKWARHSTTQAQDYEIALGVLRDVREGSREVEGITVPGAAAGGHMARAPKTGKLALTWHDEVDRFVDRTVPAADRDSARVALTMFITERLAAMQRHVYTEAADLASARDILGNIKRGDIPLNGIMKMYQARLDMVVGAAPDVQQGKPR